MTKQNIKTRSGFTIIEVVLVLAIAGLIFLMVFIALPALQRNQRDTQRRQDYAALSSQITTYMANNGGKLPNDGATLDAKQYLNKDGKDPNGKNYILKVVKATNGMTPAVPTGNSGSQVFVYTMADCSGTAEGTGYAQPNYKNSQKAYAIYGYLESGTYCTANQN